MPADLALVGAACPLPRTDRSVVLDIGRVQVERRRLPIEQRMHPGEHLVERPVELADVPQAEAAQKAAERRRLRQPVTAQKLLRRIAAHQRDVVEALAARDQRLAQTEDRLRRRVAAAALLHRHTVEQLAKAKPADQFAHEDEPGMRRQLLRRRGIRTIADRSVSFTFKSASLSLAGCLATPIVSGREDVPSQPPTALPQDPGS